jgi:hypothetical protein
VANAFAALTELSHFAAPGVVFSGSGPNADRPAAPTPPFGRCLLLQLPASADGPVALRELTAQAGDFLCRDLTTGLGQAADDGRARLGLPETRLPCRAFGTYSFSVPRRPLLQRVAHGLCGRLVRAWQVSTPEALDESIQTWLAGQLTRWELSPEFLGARLQEAATTILDETPESFCYAVVERWARGGPEDLGRQPAAADKAAEEVEGLVGPSRSAEATETGARLREALAEARGTVTEEAEKRLAEVALGALVEPQFRLIAAEEAVQRQLHAALGAAAGQVKEQSAERARQAREVGQRIQPVLESLQNTSFLLWGRRARAAAELIDLFREYVSVRLEAMLSEQLTELLLELQKNLHRYLLTVDCCRARVDQFLASFGDPAAGGAAAEDLGLGRYLLPAGCRTLGEAVERVVASLTPEEEQALHQKVHDLIGKTLQAHLHLCTAPPAQFKELKEAIDREVAAVAEASLGRAHAAGLYMEQHANDAAALADLAGAFAEAEAELGAARRDPREELAILAVPTDPEGERFRELVARALPETDLLAVPSTDDVVFYRERPNVRLTDLPQLGPAAREVYQQVLDSDQLSPHSRGDVAEW